jgi:hypothetical protein
MKYIIEIAKEYEEYFKGILICGIADGKFAADVIAREDLEELTSDYINEHFGELQDTAYQRGLNDAWEAARKISVIELNGGLTGKELMKIYGTMDIHKIYDDNTASEAIAKLKAYEEKQNDKFEFGDEIIDLNGVKGCVVSKDNEGLDTMYALFDGCRVPQYVTQSNYHKTGKHYDIEKILEAMRK